MPKVGNNNDPLYERLIFGYDGAVYRVVKIDADGNIVSAIKTGQTIAVTQSTASNLKALVDVNAGQTIAVTQATASNLKALVDVNAGQGIDARLHGFNAAAWIKGGIPLNYNSTLAVNGNQTSAGGAINISAGPVPSDEIWVINNASITNNSRAGVIALSYLALSGGGTIFLTAKLATVQYVPDNILYPVIMNSGDVFMFNMQGAVAGDSISGGLSGYKVKKA